jgi:hypothetical protein
MICSCLPAVTPKRLHYAFRRSRVPAPVRAGQPRIRAAAPLLCALRAFRAGPRSSITHSLEFNSTAQSGVGSCLSRAIERQVFPKTDFVTNTRNHFDPAIL